MPRLPIWLVVSGCIVVGCGGSSSNNHEDGGAGGTTGAAGGIAGSAAGGGGGSAAGQSGAAARGGASGGTNVGGQGGASGTGGGSGVGGSTAGGGGNDGGAGIAGSAAGRGGAGGGAGSAAGRGGAGGTGGGAGGSGIIGKHAVGLDEACEGVPGLTGRAILDQRADHIVTTLGYITAQAMRVDLTALTIDLTWPASPMAVCYEPYFENGVMIAAARVAIEGLSMRFVTADGKFNETLPAKAWLPFVNGALQFPQLLAVTLRANLQGTWQPFPEYTGNTINFFSRLSSANPNTVNGNVGLGGEIPAQLDAAIFRSRAAVATW